MRTPHDSAPVNEDHQEGCFGRTESFLYVLLIPKQHIYFFYGYNIDKPFEEVRVLNENQFGVILENILDKVNAISEGQKILAQGQSRLEEKVDRIEIKVDNLESDVRVLKRDVKIIKSKA